MSNIKQTVAESLAAFITANISGVPCFSQWADEEEIAAFPSIAIIPGKLSLTPWQEDELDEPDDDTLILSVGDLEGDCDIRVYAKSIDERADLAQRVQDLFFLRPGAPGVIVTQTADLPLNVAGTPTTTMYGAPASFTLEEEMWNEEKVFSKKRYDFITIGCVMPCVIARADSTINTMVAATVIESDLTETLPIADIEQVQVDENGNITKYP